MGLRIQGAGTLATSDLSTSELVSTEFSDRPYDSEQMPCALVRLLLTAILAIFVVLTPPAATAAEKRKPVSAEEVAKLKRENDVLRAENQRLRKMLAESPAKPQSADEPLAKAKPSKDSDARAGQAGNEKASGFWLSDNGKRHTPKCRYYRATKGAPCNANDGVACKVCGG